jgi:hypothetical protein
MRVTRISKPGTILAVNSNQIILLQLLVTAKMVPSSPILVTLMMRMIHSFKTLVLTRATWRHIPEDGVLHGHRCGNLISYTRVIPDNKKQKLYRINFKYRCCRLLGSACVAMMSKLHCNRTPPCHIVHLGLNGGQHRLPKSLQIKE